MTSVFVLEISVNLFTETAGVPPASRYAGINSRWLRLRYLGGRDARGPCEEVDTDEASRVFSVEF